MNETQSVFGYVCLYDGKRIEVDAPSSYAAQQKAAALFKARKPWQVTVVLAEKNGQSVVHLPLH